MLVVQIGHGLFQPSENKETFLVNEINGVTAVNLMDLLELPINQSISTVILITKMIFVDDQSNQNIVCKN